MFLSPRVQPTAFVIHEPTGAADFFANLLTFSVETPVHLTAWRAVGMSPGGGYLPVVAAPRANTRPLQYDHPRTCF